MAKNPFENLPTTQRKQTANTDQTGGTPAAENKQQQEKPIECTIIVSGLNYGQNGNLLQEADTDHIVILFDAVPNYTYSRTIQKTEFATEDRCTLSDHAVIKDDVFSLTCYVNTSPTVIRKGNYIDASTDPDRPAESRRPAQALEILKRCVDERQVIKLATEEGDLDSFIITKLTAKRDTGEGAAVVFDLELTQFRTFTIGKTVNANIYTDSKKTPTQNKGAVQSSDVGKSHNALAKEDTAMTNKAKPEGEQDLDKHKSHVINTRQKGGTTIQTVKGSNVQSDIPR